MGNVVTRFRSTRPEAAAWRPLCFSAVARSAVYPLAATSSALIGNDIAPAKLADDRQIEHGKVAGATFDLEFCPDCPDMSGSQRRLRPCHLTFNPRHSFADRRCGVLLILQDHTPRLQRRRNMEAGNMVCAKLCLKPIAFFQRIKRTKIIPLHY
jgi:hypothetical protein